MRPDFQVLRWFLTVLLAALAGPTLAAEKPVTIPFRVLWTIEPQQLPNEPITVGKGQPVASARLLPAKLARLAENISIPEKTISLLSSTTLIVLESPKIVACTMNVPAFAQTMKPKSGLWSKQNRYFCLTDYDRDSHFEGYFWLYTHLLGSLQGQAYLPPVEGDLQPVSYTIQSPEDAIDPPKLYIQYSGGGRFIVVPQSPNNEVPLLATVGPGIRLNTKKLPNRFSLYGAEFEVLSLAKGKVTVQTLKPFEAQPFYVHR